MFDRTSCGSWISRLTNGWPILLLLTKSAYGSIFRILYLIVSYNFKNCNISIIKKKKEKRFTESEYSSSSIEIGKKTNNDLNLWEVILLRDQERSLKMAPAVYNNGCDAAYPGGYLERKTEGREVQRGSTSSVPTKLKISRLTCARIFIDRCRGFCITSRADLESRRKYRRYRVISPLSPPALREIRV